MGRGYWDTTTATNYINATYTTANSTVRSFADLSALNVQEIYKADHLDPMLNPKNIVREARESEDHPTIYPIILGLDVTGSMSHSLVMCASKLDEIMGELYKKVEGVQFCMVGIGDFLYDSAPFQCTQFESDIRILDQSCKIYQERGGGGNNVESYTAVWYFGLHHTDLDCWKHGEKGLIITMGDEGCPNYLPRNRVNEVFGDSIETDVETNKLYQEALEKFDIYHIAITNDSSYKRHEQVIKDTWEPLLGEHFLRAKSDDLPRIISQIVDDRKVFSNTMGIKVTDDGISW